MPFLSMIQSEACAQNIQTPDRIVRIAEIEVYPEYLEQYKKLAQEIAEASVKTEEGVVVIMPMQINNETSQFRILEIYKGQKDYQSHLTTDHFKKYKTLTAPMVKSLKLVDMTPLNSTQIPEIFAKAKNRNK